MATDYSTRQRVYLSAKPIFSGNDALIRRRKNVLKMVRKYKTTLRPLLDEFGETTLVDILRRLLEDRIFQSPILAKSEFPSLFVTSHRDAEREASEAEAVRSTQDALEDMQSDNEDGSLRKDNLAWGLAAQDDGPRGDDIPVGEYPPAEECPPAEDGIPVEDPSLNTMKKNDPPKLHTAFSHPEFPDIPSLYPSYIPYKTQHLLLTTSQQILEECCFDFATKWLPDIVQKHGWDCPAAVELTKWTGIIGRKHNGKIPPIALDLAGSSLKQLLTNTHKLRHTAVHRLPTTARGISQHLQYAVQLATALKDHSRAAQLRDLQSEVDSKIKAMELTKNFLENDTSAKLEEIRQQREELNRREKELIANMVREDEENKELIGKLLMESAQKVLGEGTGSEETKGLGEREGDDDDAESGSEESEGDGVDVDESNGGFGAWLKGVSVWRGWYIGTKFS